MARPQFLQRPVVYVNLSTNPMQLGAVAGTPGTLPTGWGLGGTGGASFASTSLSSTVVGQGTDTNGFPYTDIRIFGTSATGNTGFTVFFNNTPNFAPIHASVPYIASIYVALTAGSLTNVTGVGVGWNDYTSGGTFVGSPAFNSVSNPTATSARGSSTATADATAANITSYYLVSLATGPVAVDMTLRFAAEQVEQGSSATSWNAAYRYPMTRVPGGGARGPILPLVPRFFPIFKVPGTDFLITTQEQPFHPLPTFGTGVQGPNIRPPITNTVLLRQEQPVHPLPATLPGVQGPNVRVPVVDRTIVPQFLPDHPLPVVRVGIQGPDVRPPVSDVLIGQPQSPFHPASIFLAGVQGPNVASLVNVLVTTREQPLQPTPLLGGGVAAVVVVGSFPLPGILLLRQETPFHPLPTTLPGVQGPNVRPPTDMAVLLRQEIPFHPASSLVAGVQGPNVRPAIVDTLLLRQEASFHPLPVLRVSVQGPNVRSPVSDRLIVVQYQPFHPDGFLRAGVLSALPSIAQFPVLLLRQESPGHPLSVLRSSHIFNQPVVGPFLPSSPLLVRQELPIYLPWTLWPGVPPFSPPPVPPPPAPFIVGRLVWLLPDPTDPPAQSGRQTRTVWLLPDPTDSQMSSPRSTRIVWLQPDTETGMQFPALLSWGPASPMDNDPYSVNTSNWMLPGDTIVGAVTATVSYLGGGAQSDISVVAGPVFQGNIITVWLTGGVPGLNYQITFRIVTQMRGPTYKTVSLPIVAARS